MTFTFFLGHQALSYALAAMFTIVTCQKLKLHAGTLVATLTAVAMIPITADHYFTAFLIRLATTSTGIIVSTLVNFSSYHHIMLKQFRDVQRSYLLKRQMLWRNGLLR